MAISTTIDVPGDDASEDAFYGWDWSQTTHALTETTVQRLVRALGGSTVLPGKGLQGWSMSLTAFDPEGFKIGTVYFGGGRDDVHVLSTSSAADTVRPLVTGLHEAKTARVDTRVDTLLPFDTLAGYLRDTAATYNAKRYFMESHHGDDSLGRTWWLGAPSSRIRIRVYEKWLESPGLYVEGTNRVEVQLRPDTRHKGVVSGWGPGETFCASKTARDLAEMLGADYAPKVSVQTSRGTPDLERTLEVMGTQYGPAVERWLTVSGGDLGRVIEHLIRARDVGPDPAESFADRLVSDRRAMDDLLRGAERVTGDPEPPF